MGVVKGDIIVTEQKEYKTDCEIVWVKIEIVGTETPYSLLHIIVPKREIHTARMSFTGH